MSVSLTSNFLLNARGFTFEDGGGISWTFNRATNTITAAGSSGALLSSVGLADNSTVPIYTVSNSPLTTNGNLTITLNAQTQKTFFAGPTSGANAQPAFRAIAAADIPTLNQNTTGTAAGLSAALPNAGLANSSVTVAAGSGLSGGGTVALGSSVTLTNAGVTSAVSGTGVGVSAATGAVTISIDQSVATTAVPTFAGVNLDPGTGTAVTVSGAAATQLNAMTVTQSGQTEWVVYSPASSNNLNFFNSSGGQFSIAQTGAIGVNGNAAPAQSTGWGSPTGTGPVSNFSGTAATNAQMQQAIATIISVLKSVGFLGT